MKKFYLYIGLCLFFLLFSTNLFYKRFDFTSDQRYTLSDASKKVLASVDSPVEIEVYLEGDFPAKFQQFKQEIRNTLEELQSSNAHINYTFIDPIKEEIPKDTLLKMGMSPSTLPEMEKGKISQILIYPYAMVKYKNYALVVSLLTSEQNTTDKVIKSSEEELEYNFIEAIHQLSSNTVKNIGWLNNHQSLKPIELSGLYETLSKKYNFQPLFHPDSTQNTLHLKDIPALKSLDALLVIKPREAFTDEEKEVLDQYIMNGGKMLWMLDAVNAEKDSLQRNGKITAFTNNLNLNDLLFSYGVRINGGVIKDYQQSGRIKIQVGQVQGNPEYAMPQWPYLALGMSQNNNPITKNLNPVLLQFASPIDTLKNDIKKTILYQSSPISEVLPTPNFISLNDLIEATPDSLLNPAKYNGNKIEAILLEGKFPSAYKGRFERTEIPDFKPESNANKMIVIGDGDVAKNDVMQGKYPVPLGIDALTNIHYGNAYFLENCIDYLLDDAGLISLRSRDIDQRLLDNQKILSQKRKWQWINLLFPIIFILLSMLLGLYFKNKKYA